MVPHPEQAEQIRFIFDSVLRERNVSNVLSLVQAKGIGLPERKCKNGVVWPANPISRAHLYRIIRNPVYVGKVRYKNKLYPGEQEGIVSAEVFQEVQDLLDAKRIKRGYTRKLIDGLLRGLLYCKECGSKMVPTYGKKNGRKHFYYICHKCQREGYASCPTKTVRQAEFNEAVIRRLSERGLLNRAEFERLSIDKQTSALMETAEKITYAYQDEYIEVFLKNGVSFGFRAKVKPHIGGVPKRERQAYKNRQKLKADKATYYKALALQIREYMRVNNLSQKQCAQALGLSSARGSQILALI